MNKAVSVFIALSLCVSFFYLVRPWALGNPYNTITPFVFTAMVDGVQSEHFKMLGNVHKPRVGGLWCAAEWLKLGRPQSAESFKDLFGWYHTVWFGATLLLLILFLKDPVFIVMATFAGTVYAITVTTYVPVTDDVHILPWDFPAMFFWTLAFLLWRRGNYLPMILVIIGGTLFKESVAVVAVLVFFTPLTWRERLKWFAVAFAGCLLVKLWITHAVLGQPEVFTAGHRDQGHYLASLKRFLAFELHPHLNTILWANGGLLVAIFFLPRPQSATEWGSVVLLLLFYFFLTITPIMDGGDFECRHWTDILPLMLIYLQQKLKAHESNEIPGSQHTVRSATRAG